MPDSRGDAPPEDGGPRPPDGPRPPGTPGPNPYELGSEPPPGSTERQPPPRPTGSGPRRPVRSHAEQDKAVRRRVRGTALLAAVAAVSAVVLPPVGFALGIAVLVSGVRIRRDEAARHLGATVTVVPIVAGTFAVLVGAGLTALAVYLGSELTEWRDCMAGANTRIAEANCQDELRRVVEEKLPGGGG
ncbi:MAG TPA: hypothetical protein VK894_07785 [Jiangellales bacterium]|nr:hypothetical protein [Jiangellales bacterium]